MTEAEWNSHVNTIQVVVEIFAQILAKMEQDATHPADIDAIRRVKTALEVIQRSIVTLATPF